MSDKGEVMEMWSRCINCSLIRHEAVVGHFNFDEKCNKCGSSRVDLTVGKEAPDWYVSAASIPSLTEKG